MLLDVVWLFVVDNVTIETIERLLLTSVKFNIKTRGIDCTRFGHFGQSVQYMQIFRGSSMSIPGRSGRSSNRMRVQRRSPTCWRCGSRRASSSAGPRHSRAARSSASNTAVSTSTLIYSSLRGVREYLEGLTEVVNKCTVRLMVSGYRSQWTHVKPSFTCALRSYPWASLCGYGSPQELLFRSIII